MPALECVKLALECVKLALECVKPASEYVKKSFSSQQFCPARFLQAGIHPINQLINQKPVQQQAPSQSVYLYPHNLTA